MKNILKQHETDLYRIFANWHFAFAFLSILLCNGCSVIDLGIGIGIDSSNKKEYILPGWQLQNLASGQKLKIYHKDFSIIEGNFYRTYLIPEEEYSIEYKVKKKNLPVDIKLPSIGDTVTFTLKTKGSSIPTKKYLYQFAGFDFNNFLVFLNQNNWFSQIPFSLIDNITDQGGNIITGSKVQELVRLGIIPSRSKIEIKNKDTIIQINPNDVVQVNVKSKSSKAALTGLLAGACLDASVYFILSHLFMNFTII